MIRRSLLSCLIVLCACAGSKSVPGARPGTAPPEKVTLSPQGGAVGALTPTPESKAAVAAADRTDADRALDAGRKPAEFLTFTGVRAGQHVADLGAGGGYTTELLARIVGPNGVVYSQNSPTMLARIGTKAVEERMARPVNANVHRVDREFDDPLPPDAAQLDLVVINLIYHDLVGHKVDRDKMNRAIFAALRPGGHYIVCDSSAQEGSGERDVSTLHRIDQKFVRAEIERAGFVLDAESNLLRNPADGRDWNTSPRAAGERRGTGDRFLLSFVKK
jgi:predicted methyltransferase